MRVKESDRIKSICTNLKLAGLKVKEFKGGFEFEGEPSLKGITFNSFGDHRIALAFGILSSVIGGNYSIDGFEAVSISNPNFVEQLKSITD